VLVNCLNFRLCVTSKSATLGRCASICRRSRPRRRHPVCCHRCVENCNGRTQRVRYSTAINKIKWTWFVNYYISLRDSHMGLFTRELIWIFFELMESIEFSSICNALNVLFCASSRTINSINQDCKRISQWNLIGSLIDLHSFRQWKSGASLPYI